VINDLQHIFEKWVEQCKKCITYQGKKRQSSHLHKVMTQSNKASPQTLQTALVLGVEVQLHACLTSALDGGEWPASHPGCSIPAERTSGINWTGDWVGLRASLDAVMRRKIPAPAENQTLVIQSVA
jgi:hypothetical protein